VSLAPPTIVGELTRCSITIRFQGLVRHATVLVFVDGQEFKVGSADWPDQRFALPAGLQLKVGQGIQTGQTVDGTPPPRSSLVVQVQDVPTALPVPVVLDPLVGCASLVVIDELSPDAAVTVTAADGTTLGGAIADGSFATVPLSRSLGVGETIDVTETACGVVGHAGSLGAEHLVPPGTALAPPQFLDQPVRSCQRVVRFGGLRAGSTLMLVRGDGTESDYTVTRTDLNARVDPPLGVGEKLLAHVVGADQCEVKPSGEVAVQAVQQTPPPVRVAGQPCPASSTLQLSGLVPSALITLAKDGDPVLEMEAAEPTQTMDLSTVRVTVGGEYQIFQSLCGLSSPSTPVWLRQPDSWPDPSIRKPVTGCSRVVLVDGSHAGSMVSVTSKLLGGQIALVPTTEGTTVVVVSPVLKTGDEIMVSIDGCDAWSGSMQVEQAEVTVPSVTRAVAGERGVTVEQVVVGSLLELRVGGLTLGSTVAAESVVAVGVSRPLVAGEVVQPLMRFCGELIAGKEFVVADRTSLTFRRFSPSGIHNTKDNWNGGRVEGIIPVGGGRAVLATERAGIWILAADGTTLPLSATWTSTQMRCARADGAVPGRFYAGTDDGLYVSDPTAPDPALAWSKVTGTPGQVVNDVLALPRHGLVVLATGRGLWIAPSSGPTAYNFTVADPLVAGQQFLSLALGPDDSVVAFGGAKIFVGRWVTGNLGWTDQTFGGTGAADGRLTTIAAQMTNGALASCAANPARVYLAVARSTPDTWFPVVRSDDGGWTWTIPANDDLVIPAAPDPNNIVGPGEIMGLTQGGRNLAVAVHPTMQDTVIIAGRRSGVLGSVDAATTWDLGRWPERDEYEFHSDSLCVTFDTASPPTLWAGGDGGVFSSADLGVTWKDHNEWFPTMMFDSYGQSAGVSLGVRPADPPVAVGALQDNGLIWSTGEGQTWHSAANSDGRRVLFLDADHVLMLTNVSGGIWLMHWNGSGMDNLGNLNPPGVPVGTNDPVIAPVLYPTFTIGGKLLIAVLADNEDPLGLWGLLDDDPGQTGLSRYRWERIGNDQGNVQGLASYDGTTVILTTTTQPTTPIRLYDTIGKLAFDCVTPGLTSGSRVTRPTFLDASTAIAAGPDRVYLTQDLVTWRPVAPLPSARTSGPQLGAPWSVAVDRRTTPATIFASSFDGLWSSLDLGTTWQPAQGLPANANVVQTQVSAIPHNQLYAGTWNWSLWLADLQ
jgi:hypothetical protein